MSICMIIWVGHLIQDDGGQMSFAGVVSGPTSR
jgi:hypothetical protein